MATLIQAQEIINSGLVRPAPLDVRFDALLLSPHINFAEKRFVTPLIGKELFNELKTEKANTISNYNANYGAIQAAFTTEHFELVWKEHLFQFCSICVVYEAIPFIIQQIGSQGLMINNTEFSTSSGVSGGKYIQDALMQRIEFMSVEIKEYLCEKKEDFIPITFDWCEGNCDATNQATSKRLGIIFY